MKLNGASCPVLDSFLYDYSGQPAGTIAIDHLSPRESLFIDINQDGFNEVVQDNHVYDNNLDAILTLGDELYQSPIVDDVNLDGVLEIIQVKTGEDLNNNTTVLITNAQDGTQVELPINVEYNSGSFLLGGYVAVGDLDNDGFKEIVSNTFDVISFTGEAYNTKPYALDIALNDLNPSILSIGDLDRNGWFEIILLTTNHHDSAENFLYIVEEGQIKHITPIEYQFLSTATDIVISDIIGDEKLEIILGGVDIIQIFDAEGNLVDETFTPLADQYFGHTVFTYDIDQDGTLELLKASDFLYIYNNNLEIVDAFDLFAVGPMFCKPQNPTFTDLNGDGTLDILTNLYGTLLCFDTVTLYAFDLGIPYVESEDHWLKIGYNAGNTRCYKCNEPCLDGFCECSDGIDNDGDGEFDYPNDPGCDSATDFDESNCGDGVCEGSETADICLADCAECIDGNDNDGDGWIDFPEDPGCQDPLDNDETNCGDGICEEEESEETCPADCAE